MLRYAQHDKEENTSHCHAERSEAESKHLVSCILAYLGFALCKAKPVLSTSARGRPQASEGIDLVYERGPPPSGAIPKSIRAIRGCINKVGSSRSKVRGPEPNISGGVPMQQVQHAGIDVSAKTLEVALAGSRAGPSAGHLCQYAPRPSCVTYLADQRRPIRPGGLRGDRLV